MSRLRLAYEKRKFSCFVRHVELPQLFGRIVRRAGLKVELTQGMSPHPHITMGSALPVGILALRDLAEIWFEELSPLDELLVLLNEKSPDGLRFLAAQEVEGSSLNKVIDSASYWICPRQLEQMDFVSTSVKDVYGDSLLHMEQLHDGIEFALSDPSQNGAGKLVRALVEQEVFAGWSDCCLARLAVGRWNETDRTVTPLL